MTRVAYYQFWLESERGWGVSPDGYKIYQTREVAVKETEAEVKEQYENNNKLLGPGVIPDVYVRPAGDPTPIEVSDFLYKEIGKKGHLYVDRLEDLPGIEKKLRKTDREAKAAAKVKTV